MRESAIYNPHNKPLEELPVIYGFNNGGADQTWYGQLMAEDGTPLGSHICSNESFMLNDLGILEGRRPDRHEHFQKHYPDGYKMEFVSHSNVDEHEKLMKAIRIAQAPDNPPSDQDASITVSTKE